MEIDFQTLDIILVLPLVALFFASLVPITIKVLKGNRELNPTSSMIYGLIGVVSAMILCVANSSVTASAFSGALVFDGISHWSAVLVLLAAAAALFLAKENLATSNHQFSETVCLILNAVIGMITVAWASDFMTLFIGIEVMSLCLYMLIAMSSEDRLSKEAAFKYFVLGSFASAIMLYGISFIYGTVGSTSVNEFIEAAPVLAPTNRLFVLGLVLLVLGLLFKISLFPFHAWAPDVYQGAPTPITAFMAVGVKAVVLGFVLRLMTTDSFLPAQSLKILDVLQWLAVLSVLVGNIAACMQTNLKRMLAYSSIAHSGYVMMGLIAVGSGSQMVFGSSGVLYYLIGYSVVSLGTFAMVSWLEKTDSDWVGLDSLKGLGMRYPVMAGCFAICLLSLAGIPPTVGFWGKFLIFSAALKQGFYWLVFWGVIGSVIGVYYYLRPIVLMFMTEDDQKGFTEGKWLTQMTLISATIIVVGLGLVSEPLVKAISLSVSSLF